MPRLIDLAESTPTPARDRFVGRERERREFRNSVRYVLEKEAPPGGSQLYPHIFLPHGEGGMGKSALLRQFVRIAHAEGLPEARVVMLDLDSDSYPSAESLAQKIALAVRRVSPEFDQRYRAARTRRDELAPRLRELKEQWARWEALRGSSDEDIDKLLDTHRRTLRHAETQQAGFGMAALPFMAAQAYESRNELAALLAFRQDRGRVPGSFQELLERELGADDAALFLHERGLGQALADDLFTLAEATPLLLALDTYELADQHDDWLRMTILANGSSRMLTIIAGRNRHDENYRRTFMGGLASLVRSYNLNDQMLQSDEVREYLRLRLDAEPTDALTDEVLQISRGIPLAVEALGDQLAGSGDIAPYRGMQAEGLDRRGVIHRVTERFLRYALDGKGDEHATRESKQHDRQRIRAPSLLLRPNAELACALWGCTAGDARQVVSRLDDRYSFIFAGYAPYEMHDLVREFVRADTLNDGRNSFDWPALDEGLRRALPVVEQRIALAEARMPDPDERYADAEWRDATLDRLNLLLWLGEDDAAKRLLLNRWIVAQYANVEFAAQLAELAHELAPQRKDWQVLLKAVESKEYERLEGYRDRLEAHARVVLDYLRARQLRLAKVESEDDLNRTNRQIALLEKSLTLDRKWKPIGIELAGTYERRGIYRINPENIFEALVDFERAAMLQPKDTTILNNRSTVKRFLGDYIGALADCDKTLALQPDDYFTLSNRGCIKDEMGNFTGALVDYNRSLTLHPNNPNTLTNRGMTKSHLRDYTGALTDYDRSLNLRPDDALTLHYRGIARGMLGDDRDALADFDRSLELRLDTPNTFYNRAITKRKLGDYNGALADYNHVLELRPNDPYTMYDLACLYALQNDPDAALNWLAKVITVEETYRVNARTDSDYDPIRADPRFLALVGDASAG